MGAGAQGERSPVKIQPLTRAQLLALPPATDIRTLALAFGISEPVARERNRLGEFQAMGIRINRLGAQYRVITADVLRVLGIDQAPAVSGPDAAHEHNGSA